MNAEPVTPLDGRPAPLDGCNCAVCRWAERQVKLDEDLELNYRRYLSGELVSRDERD